MFRAENSPILNQALTQFRSDQPLNGITGISLEVAVLSQYRQELKEIVDHRLEGDFWISPDICVAHPIVLPPRKVTSVPILLPDSFEPFEGLPSYVFSTVLGTTRSRFAQLGLEVLHSAGTDIAQSLPGDVYRSGQGFQEAQVLVGNYALRPIKLDVGTPFFYMYYWDRETVRGSELKSLVGSALLIEGGEGEAWQWYYGPNSVGDPDGVEGIEFFINQDTATYIPEANQPLVIDGGVARNHNRESVDYYLEKPVPYTDEMILWIAELKAHLHINKGIHGILDTSATRRTFNSISAANNNPHTQINSVLLRGGNTSSHIRTEIFGPYQPGAIPDTVLVRIARG